MSNTKQLTKYCSVWLSSQKEFDEVYEKAIKPACDSTDLAPIRIDKLSVGGNSLKGILEIVSNSPVIVVDSSDLNPGGSSALNSNVSYELGIAHATDKKVIVITQNRDRQPFDFQIFQYIQYKHNEEGLNTLKVNLTKALQFAKESIYKREKPRIFLSYAKEDHEMAKRIYDDLKREGLTPWLDRENLLPGENWKKTITQEIKDCSYFLALLSSHSISKRGFVQKELKIALDVFDEIPESEIYLIPVRLDECEPKNEILQDLHWVDLFPNYEEGLKNVLRVFIPEKIFKFQENIEKLSKQARQGTDSERIEAAKTLRSLGTAEAIPVLIELMGYDPERSRETIPVRNAAREALILLGKTFRVQIVQAMRQVLHDKTQHRYIRRRAVYILGKLEAKEALVDLINVAKDPDEQLRRRVADALKNLGSREGLSTLEQLAKDPTKEVREHAQDALSKYSTNLQESIYGWLYVGNYDTQHKKWITNTIGFITTIKDIQHLSPKDLVNKTFEMIRDMNIREEPTQNSKLKGIKERDSKIRVTTLVEKPHQITTVKIIWVGISG